MPDEESLSREVEEARQWAGEALEELLRAGRLGDEDTFVDLILDAVEPHYLSVVAAVRKQERAQVLAEMADAARPRLGTGGHLSGPQVAAYNGAAPVEGGEG